MPAPDYMLFPPTLLAIWRDHARWNRVEACRPYKTLFPRASCMCVCARAREQRSTWREAERVCVCVRSRDAWMEEARGGSCREANGGQPEREELACDGSCPGLILSVCAGWQKGCKGRLDPPSAAPPIHTHTRLGLKPTDRQAMIP